MCVAKCLTQNCGYLPHNITFMLHYDIFIVKLHKILGKKPNMTDFLVLHDVISMKYRDSGENPPAMALE